MQLAANARSVDDAPIEIRPWPLLFLITALAYLAISVLIGFYLSPTDPQPVLRWVHVHFALVGGVAQMILGAMTFFVPTLFKTPRAPGRLLLAQYALINLGAVGMAAAEGSGRNELIGFFGALVFFAFALFSWDFIKLARVSLGPLNLNLWFYATAVAFALSGMLIGVHLTHAPSAGLRQVHIHVNLLGFVIMVVVGTMHNFFPTVIGSPLGSSRAAVATFWLLTLGTADLAVGLGLSSRPVVLLGGAIAFLGALTYAVNIMQTARRCPRPLTPSGWHLLLGTPYLLFTFIAGIALAAGLVPSKPPDLAAYTHIAMLGFLLQTIMGALTFLLPLLGSLAVTSVPIKRMPLVQEMERKMNRFALLQILGTNIGVVLYAFVLRSVDGDSMGMEISKAVLGASLLLFAGKCMWALTGLRDRTG